MRLHPRRTFLIFICVILFVILAVHIYTQSASLSKKKKRGFVSSFRNFYNGKNGKHIFWTKDSGIRKLAQKTDVDLSSKRKKFDGNHSTWTVWSRSQKIGVDAGNEDDDERKQLMKINFNMNTSLSDLIPLNRDVPDSRPRGCDKLMYPTKLPSISVVIPFHNEWPSVLMRTVHSLVHRTPGYLLKKIVLVDDASTLKSLKVRLSNYVKWTFPKGLVKIVRLSSRQGLIKARLEGFKEVTSDTVSFFDSHMEVNKDWLQPLLYEIKKDRKTVAMTQLDYIDRDNFKYKFYEHYRTRYGFKWDMEFFETYFRPDQLAGKSETDPMPGVVMVGPGFVVETQYFKQLGTYDKAMKIWGGENIEFAWRTWLCGGRMVHVPCSRVGHIERSQPYTFPEGRKETELHNYKRAVDVWMGPYKKYVYEALPDIKDIAVGNLTERLRLKEKLKCKDFSWFLQHIWPELLPYKDVGKHWGYIKTYHGNACLDNNGYLFQDAVPLELKACVNMIQTQGFALTDAGQLRTTLHCVAVHNEGGSYMPFIENCFLNLETMWYYDKKLRLVHEPSHQCLQVMAGGSLVLQPCQHGQVNQKWIFKHSI